MQPKPGPGRLAAPNSLRPGLSFRRHLRHIELGAPEEDEFERPADGQDILFARALDLQRHDLGTFCKLSAKIRKLLERRENAPSGRKAIAARLNPFLIARLGRISIGLPRNVSSS